MPRPFQLTAATVILLATHAAQAAIYRVGSDAACTHATIQAAIDSAAASGGADEIRIRTGIYPDTALQISGEPQALHLIGGFPSCADAAPEPNAVSTLQGSSGHAVVTIQASPAVTLERLVLADADNGYDGGGIYFSATAGQLTLVDAVAASNHANSGGGIFMANSDGAADPGALRLVLRGRSGLYGNVAANGGGGVYCIRATIRVEDRTEISNNSALVGDGGGIAAHDCRVEVGSRGNANPALWLNQAPDGHGGALYLHGQAASAAIYPVGASAPTRLHLNRARRGGAIAAGGGARVDVHQGWIGQNRATAEGGAIWLAEGDAAGVDTRFAMHDSLEGAPSGAVACAPDEDCNRMQANLVLDGIGNPGSGAALAIVAATPGAASGSAHARFEGTRIDDSTGYSLVTQAGSDSHIVFDGALIVDNDLSGQLAVGVSPSNSLGIVASTVAANALGSGSTVLFGPIACSVDTEARGTRVERSIVWQPGHALLTTFGGTPQPDCYRHLVGNDFSGLPASPERVAADPQFLSTTLRDYRLDAYSPALDFAPAHPADATRDGGPRVFDIAGYGNRFGPQDLGAYEYAPDDLIFAHGFD
ncbi:MAG: hypothetical protein J0L88_09030 [Xanthomonadales bacterium]|nr:hypothetical protein [Xanthomonadales bacterium]